MENSSCGPSGWWNTTWSYSILHPWRMDLSTLHIHQFKQKMKWQLEILSTLLAFLFFSSLKDSLNKMCLTKFAMEIEVAMFWREVNENINVGLFWDTTFTSIIFSCHATLLSLPFGSSAKNWGACVRAHTHIYGLSLSYT